MKLGIAKPWLLSMAACMSAFAGGGCASRAGPPPATATSVHGGALVVTGAGHARALPYAPSGTAFDVRLDQAVDTRLNAPGEAVSATLIQPILATNGDALVPEGTRLLGRVEAVYHSPFPRIVLVFDSLGLQGGSVPVGTNVLSVQESRYRELPQPPGVTSMQPAAGARSSRVATDQVSMAKGAVLRVVLTTPIVEARVHE